MRILEGSPLDPAPDPLALGALRETEGGTMGTDEKSWSLIISCVAR